METSAFVSWEGIPQGGPQKGLPYFYLPGMPEITVAGAPQILQKYLLQQPIT